jgi:hypothetical protein
MRPTTNSPTTMRVWLGSREVERPIARFETKERKLFGGFPEVIRVPVPELNAGETAVRWRHRVLIMRQNETRAER